MRRKQRHLTKGKSMSKAEGFKKKDGVQMYGWVEGGHACLEKVEGSTC